MHVMLAEIILLLAYRIAARLHRERFSRIKSSKCMMVQILPILHLTFT